MIAYPRDLKPEEESAYRRGLDDAREAQCKLCWVHGAPVWSDAAGAYFHKVGQLFKGCKSEFIVALLDGRRLA